MAYLAPTSFITHENLTSSLICPICQLTFSEPKLLSCAHTFCGRCISSLIKINKEISCPLCRTITVVDKGDVSNLQTNFTLEAVVQSLADSHDSCCLCKSLKSVDVLMCCHECRILICDGCREKHDSMEENQGHTVSRKEPDLSFTDETHCSRHGEEMCTFLCIECKKLICRKCKTEHEDEEHEIRRTVSLAIDVYMKMNRIKEQIRNGVGDIQRSTDLYSTLQRESDVSIDEVMSKIEKDHSLLVARLEERKKKLIGKCQNLKKGVEEVVDQEQRSARDGKFSFCKC